MWGVWLVIAGVCFIIEMVNIGFFIFWFGIGALMAMITSFIVPNNIFIQTLVFTITSVILLILTKPLVERFTKKDKKIETNAYSILGKKAIVTKDINPTLGVGQIKVAGEVWSAKTDDETIIEKDTEVEIIKIDGVKAVVKPVMVKSKTANE